MGRQSEAIINHFSHPHPLHLTNPQPSRSCSACSKTLGTEPFYTCKAPSCTNYALHVKCTQLPYRITHPCHHHHHNQPLSLLSRAYKPNGVFACHACGKNGDSFAYNCNDCDINIHVGCATLPLYISHGSHAHQLTLVFAPPYGRNAFSCDICGEIGAVNCWLYRCVPCGYDAHVSCASATSKKHVVAESSRSVVVPPEALFLEEYNKMTNMYLQQMMGGVAAATNNMSNQILQQGLAGAGGGAGNPFLQGMMGGGGGNPLLQGMMGGGSGGNPLLQGLMGGSGGGNPLLQGLMGGGGGGNPLLQGLMGGGGGGNPLLQGLMGGGDMGQGVGGLDFSSALGGIGDIGGLMGGLGGFGLF